MTTTRLARLALVALLLVACPPDSEAMTAHRTFVGPLPPGGVDMATLTITATVVSTTSLHVVGGPGVLVAEWGCSGTSLCGDSERDHTRVALHDGRVLGVTFIVDPGAPEPLRERHVGGTLAWVGEASVRLASAGGGR